MLRICVTSIVHGLTGIRCILMCVVDLDLCVGYSIVVFRQRRYGFCLTIIPVITTFVMRKRIRLHYARDSRSELIREISVFLATRDTSTR